MAILAQKGMLSVLMAGGIIFPSCAFANLFGMDKIDYFSLRKVQEERYVAADPLWSERGGSPPMVVEMFLNDPNELTARKYLDWQKERLQKIARAQGVLERMSE
ncbi:MAG: hypothetical protein WCI27_09425 [Candidatus Omnitrophota bacterium]